MNDMVDSIKTSKTDKVLMKIAFITNQSCFGV